MIPQPSSFTRPKQSGKFTAGCVVGIAGRCFLSTVAQQWSGHGSGLQIIGGSLLYWNLGGPRLFHNAGGRPVLKATCCSGRSRASGKKGETSAGCDVAGADCAQCYEAEVEAIEPIHGSGSRIRVEREGSSRRQLVYEPVSECPHQTEHQVGGNTRTEHFSVDRRRTKNEAQQISDDESNQDEPSNEEDCRWNQVRAEMIYPPSGDRRNCKHDRDDQDAFAIRDRKDASKQDQRKQAGYNELTTFNFLDKRRPHEKESQRNEKLHRGEAPES